MQILSAASAFPKYYYSQDVLSRALEEYWGDKLGNPALMRRLHRHTGVEGRYLSLPLHAYTKLATWARPIVSGFKPLSSWASRPSAALLTVLAGAARSGRFLFHVRNRYLESID